MAFRVFIGYDKAEVAAYQVCSYSIIKNAKRPVSIQPLNIRHLPWFTNNDYKSSTEFAFSRFLVPYLSDYKGYSLFMDADMLVRTDITRVCDFIDTQGDKAVCVVKHPPYDINPGDKFLGAEQTIYSKKNWSSVMLFNNERCKRLDPAYVNTAPGLDLHQFKWCEEEDIGELPRSWNYLVGEEVEQQIDPDIVHFTRGGPYFEDYKNCEFSDEWRKYFKESISVLDHKYVSWRNEGPGEWV